MKTRQNTLPNDAPPPSQLAKCIRFTDGNTPVTYYPNGNVFSRFGDDLWDFSAYTRSSGRRTIFFGLDFPLSVAPELAEEICLELKQILFHLYIDVSLGQSAWKTIVGKFRVLSKLAMFASTRGISLYQALQSRQVLLSLAGSSSGGRWAERIHTILAELHGLGFEKTGLRIPFLVTSNELLAIANSHDAYKQHPPIPSRIYSEFISTLERQLSSFEAVSTDFQEFLDAALQSDFANIEPSSKLKEYLTNRVSEINRYSIFDVISKLSVVFHLTILTFTGMRADEAEGLPFDCLSLVGLPGNQQYVVGGVTTKLHKGAKRVTWVTSSLGARAITAAKAIYGVIHRTLGSGAYASSKDGSHLLMCRLGRGGTNYVPNLASSNLYGAIRDFAQHNLSCIQESDLAELKLIDPIRTWDAEEKFEIGLVWQLSRHQLRRTLALYAHASGIVSIPTLKRQLQQITAAMARYYANGSVFSKNILSNKRDHIGNEWREAGSFSRYLAYAKVVFSDKKLFGGHSNWANSPTVKESPVSIHNRQKTEAAFRKGQISFQPTPFGGCTSTEPCKKSPMSWLPLECLEKDCRHLIGIVDRLRTVTSSQEKLVKGLAEVGTHTVQYNFESDILKRLKRLEEKYA